MAARMATRYHRLEAESRVPTDVFAGTEALIEHVGSTAVLPLGSKPVIDVMIGVPALALAAERIPLLGTFTPTIEKSPV